MAWRKKKKKARLGADGRKKESPETSDANLYFGTFSLYFLDVVQSFSGVTFSLCYVFKENLNASKPSEHPPQKWKCV